MIRDLKQMIESIEDTIKGYEQRTENYRLEVLRQMKGKRKKQKSD